MSWRPVTSISRPWAAKSTSFGKKSPDNRKKLRSQNRVEGLCPDSVIVWRTSSRSSGIFYKGSRASAKTPTGNNPQRDFCSFWRNCGAPLSPWMGASSTAWSTTWSTSPATFFRQSANPNRQLPKIWTEPMRKYQC